MTGRGPVAAKQGLPRGHSQVTEGNPDGTVSPQASPHKHPPVPPIHLQTHDRADEASPLEVVVLIAFRVSSVPFPGGIIRQLQFRHALWKATGMLRIHHGSFFASTTTQIKRETGLSFPPLRNLCS